MQLLGQTALSILQSRHSVSPSLGVVRLHTDGLHGSNVALDQKPETTCCNGR